MRDYPTTLLWMRQRVAGRYSEMAGRGVLEGAELMPFSTTLGKIFAERRPTASVP